MTYKELFDKLQELKIGLSTQITVNIKGEQEFVQDIRVKDLYIPELIIKDSEY